MSALVIDLLFAMSGPEVYPAMPATEVSDAEEAGSVEDLGQIDSDCNLSLESTVNDPGQDRDLCLYRDRTFAILRRYMRMALETGRMPSLLGREFFRTKVTSYHTQTFEDSVIFVHDIETCLELLDGIDKTLIAMIALQEHTQEETAALLGCTDRTITRRYQDALDRVSEIFLKREILMRIPEKERVVEEPCQGGENIDFLVNASI